MATESASSCAVRLSWVCEKKFSVISGAFCISGSDDGDILFLFMS